MKPACPAWRAVSSMTESRAHRRSRVLRRASSSLRPASEALALAAIGRQRHGLPAQPEPAARFHFTLPGSVHGFQAEPRGAAVANDGGRLSIGGSATVLTPTFIPPDAQDMPLYGLVASPTLYSGQTIRARVDGPARLVIQAYTGTDEPRTIEGPAA